MADLAYARHKLRLMTQNRSESVQNYFERLMVQACQAYGDSQLHNQFVEQQLVEIFLDGLVDDQIALRMIRSKPTTLEKALEIATSEQQAKKVFDLRRGRKSERTETLEIDAISSLPQTTESKNSFGWADKSCFMSEEYPKNE